MHRHEHLAIYSDGLRLIRVDLLLNVGLWMLETKLYKYF